MSNDYENGPQAPNETEQGAPFPPHAPYYTSVPPEPNPPQKVRRVGTLTMGLALILTGIAAIISMLFPSFDFTLFAKLVPLVLVFLGIEILVCHFFAGGAKLKYDFMSGFICFILICGSICALLIPPLYRQYGYRYTHENRIERELDDLCFTTLQGLPIASLYSEIHLQGTIEGGPEAITSQTLRPADYVRLNITLLGNFTDKQQFAQSCKAVLDKVNTFGIEFDKINFSSIETETSARYELDIDDRFRAALPVSQLATLVDDDAWEREQERLESQREREASRSEAEQSRLESQSEAEQSRLESQRELEYSRSEAEQSRLESQQEAEQSRLESQQEAEQSRT